MYLMRTGMHYFSDPCDGVICENGGNCLILHTTKSFTCRCVNNYYGNYCEKQPGMSSKSSKMLSSVFTLNYFVK